MVISKFVYHADFGILILALSFFLSLLKLLMEFVFTGPCYFILEGNYYFLCTSAMTFMLLDDESERQSSLLFWNLPCEVRK